MKIVISLEIEGCKIVNLKTEAVEDKPKTDYGMPNEYARLFDDGCEGWTKDPEYNLTFLRTQERYANEVLRSKGYIFLNDVYEMLGIKRTKAGQVVGWVYDKYNPIGDNYVDFGLTKDCNTETEIADMDGNRFILLDFNVDGNILDRI